MRTIGLRVKIGRWLASALAAWIRREEAAFRAHPLRGYLIIATTFVVAAVLPFYSGIWPIASSVVFQDM